MPIVDGSRYRPETTTDAPKPKPVLFGSCANCGSTMNDEYMPAPSRNAARFVVHTPRMRIIAMSISGSALRDLDRGSTASETISPAAISPSVLAEPQPHTVVCEIAMQDRRDADRHQRRREPVDLGRESATGDSGMNRHVATAATSVATSGIQNSQW